MCQDQLGYSTQNNLELDSLGKQRLGKIKNTSKDSIKK